MCNSRELYRLTILISVGLRDLWAVKNKEKREENIDRVNIDFIKKTLQNWPFLAGK